MDQFVEKLSEIPLPVRQREAVTTSALNRLGDVMQHYNDAATEFIAKKHGSIDAGAILNTQIQPHDSNEPKITPDAKDDALSVAQANVNAAISAVPSQNPLEEMLKNAGN